MTILEELKSLLKKDERLVSDDNLLKNRIVELALKSDKDLIKLLLSNKRIKEHFFEEVDKTLIFDKEKFMKFVDNKEFLPDSYTSFKNKIGLTADKRYIAKSKEVVLSWPYKDCILEGGQEKEDEKRKEIFHNEILAPDEIDRLLEPKVFTNFKRIDAKGEHKVTEIKPNENLIIKGNNFLVLNSLKKRFAEKVKLIYIDPPYNTGSDTFGYNNDFNHSTWLTFMKNRLEIAKELLKNDGVIFIHLDYNESHYCKILLDEIFGRDKFINEIIWRRKSGTANESRRFATAFDTILLYGKTENYDFFPVKEKDSKKVQEYIKERFIRKDETGPHKGRLWAPYPLANPGEPTPGLIYDYKGYKCPTKGWRIKKETMEKWDKEGRLFFPEDKKQRISEKKFLDEYEGQPVNNLWTDIYVINPMAKEALDFDGQKPEKLLQRILLLATKQEDLVLDFFSGSGTTGAVAHKMKRQYILVEQMKNQIDVISTRLKNVIGKSISKGKLSETIEDYDKTGISESMNWKGGGEFVYCELKELNEEFVQKIKKTNDTKELLKIWEEMKEHAFLSYRVDPKLFDENIEEFKKLLTEEQKKLLIECLDANNLYVNFSEMKDTQYKLSKEDIELNTKFYGRL